jgi:hypothetical protein
MPSRAFSREEIADADFVAGVEEAQEKVTRFIDKLGEAEVEGDVTIILKQLGVGESAVIIDVTFTPGEDPVAVADSLVDAAREEGDVLGGVRKFEITVAGHKGRCVFSLQFKEKDDDEIDEAPNGKGLVSQQMRHNEKLVKLVIGLTAETSKTSRQQLHEANERVKNLEKVHLEGIKTYAEILDAKQLRDLEMTKLLKSEERKDQVGGMLMQSIPAIANKFLGGKVVSGPTALENMLEGFFRTFTPEQLQETVQTGNLKMRPEQMMGLMEMLKSILQSKEKEPQKLEEKTQAAE